MVTVIRVVEVAVAGQVVVDAVIVLVAVVEAGAVVVVSMTVTEAFTSD